MWMICGILSVVFCVIGWIMVSRENSMACWAAACSLVFVSLTLLMEYRMVLNWVNAEDWGALSDVVPSMFSMLIGYVIILFLANAISIGVVRKK